MYPRYVNKYKDNGFMLGALPGTAQGMEIHMSTGPVSWAWDHLAEDPPYLRLRVNRCDSSLASLLGVGDSGIQGLFIGLDCIGNDPCWSSRARIRLTVKDDPPPIGETDVGIGNGGVASSPCSLEAVTIVRTLGDRLNGLEKLLPAPIL
ncbi:hypothetical protein AO1008_06930 [Aspergillus oryzae 100-8]|uniref:Uncharacterized protein n=1 Tax=Aspergillus oryzae (strain 3.042) TaxID=1160506 RepID=I8U4V9_ASPO3|nr:hypothetical protein Ao3042_01793 [Aspergillus oryzae 3.042]KDE80796.1 hypothetical protein AO1008_06930 [Aspergillus oryzae 100-8]|eukprot:EIT81763.1 hypothetical protein Ao3042_01793 [Aspergillus oryzae 3.042]